MRVFLIAGLTLSAGWIWATPPPNDTCVGAEIVPGTGPFPYATSITADVTEATTAGETVEPSCMGLFSRSIWYRFTPTQTAFYRVSVSGDTATTVNDTIMAIYTSAGGCAGPFTEIDCNDDAGLSEPHLLKSAIVRVLNAGTTYYIVVWVLTGEEYPPTPGFTAVQLRISIPDIPGNDECQGVEVIPSSGPFPYLTDITDTLLASSSPSDPIPSCRIGTNSERSVWFQFTPEQSTLYSISTDTLATTIFDTTLAIYTSSNGCLGPWVEYACNDDIFSGFNLSSDIKANLNAGTTYYIVAYDTEEEPAVTETELQLRVTIPPEAITLPASSISSAGATVNGIVRPNGSRTFFWFEWGQNTTYTNQKSATKLLFGSVPEVVTNAVFTGILPNTLYHYRLVATNSNGRAEGEDRTFLWSTNPPSLNNYTIPVSGGSFQFQFNGSPGQVYEVETSTNLLNWTSMGSASDLGGGEFQFMDPTEPAVPYRFYRIRSP